MRWMLMLLCCLPLMAHAGAARKAGATAPSVLVQVARLHSDTLNETITAYGKVRPDPDHLTTINVNHAATVVKLSVSPGQRVQAGDPLLELATAPAARVAFQQAKAELEFARQQRERERQLFKEKLATHADLAAAEKALANARATVAAQKQMGNNQTTQLLRAPFDGIVTAVKAGVGDRVAAGTALLNLSRGNRLVVALGIEPEAVTRVHSGTPVALSRIFVPGAVFNTRVAQVHGTVDPRTHLVDALVKLPPDKTDHLLPGMRVRGVLTLRSVKTLAVPRSAVLSDDQGAYMFIVRDGKAHRVDVRVGIRAGGKVEVHGPLHAGAVVVVQGNYELKDGMTVRERGA